jgi:hypothetical protein
MGLEFRVVVLSFGQSHKYLPELASLGNGHFAFLYWPPCIEVKWEPIPWVPSSSWLGDDSLYFRHIFSLPHFCQRGKNVHSMLETCCIFHVLLMYVIHGKCTLLFVLFVVDLLSLSNIVSTPIVCCQEMQY